MHIGILFIETPYADEDFKAKWIEIKEVYLTTRFLITLADGRRIKGILNTNKEGKLIIQE